MNSRSTVSREIARRLRGVERIASESFDVTAMEPALVDLLDYLRDAHAGHQVEAEQALNDVVERWPLGATEALEFTMRELRWDSVKTALEGKIRSDADFRERDEARRVLEAYASNWPGGEIYAWYRRSEPGRRYRGTRHTRSR